MRFELINQCQELTDKAEIRRIYESFQSRVHDFCEKNNIDVNAALIINPNSAQLSDAVALTDTNYILVSDSLKKSDCNLSNLEGRLRFFTFKGKKIENLLFVIAEITSDNSNNKLSKNTSMPSKIQKCFIEADDLERLNNWITLVKSRTNKSFFLCISGESGVGKTSTAEYISGKFGEQSDTITIKEVFANKKVLDKLSDGSYTGVVILDNFDFLFADSRPEKPIVTELETLRISILNAIDTNRVSLIMIVSSIEKVTAEFKSRMSFFVRIDKPSYAVRNEIVSAFCSDSAKTGLIASRLAGYNQRELFNALKGLKYICNGDIALLCDSVINSVIDDSIKNKEHLFAPEVSDFKIIKPTETLDKVVMTDKNKETLLTALSSVVNEHLIYDIWGFRDVDPNVRSIINFYGPPGTGKTMCANAIANELSVLTGKPYELLSLKYSEIESMYVGEAPKKLEKVFNYARNKNVVLFFDEADSFLGKRITNVSQGAEQAINSLRSTMLIQLEKYHGVVIFATNLTANYDHAFKTRFLAEIEFNLPDIDACKSIILVNMPEKTKSQFAEDFGEIDLNTLAQKAVGLSGRDIKTVIWRVLAKAARLHGLEYHFLLSDFENEFDQYKFEKQSTPKVDSTTLAKAEVVKTPDADKVKDLIR